MSIWAEIAFPRDTKPGWIHTLSLSERSTKRANNIKIYVVGGNQNKIGVH